MVLHVGQQAYHSMSTIFLRRFVALSLGVAYFHLAGGLDLRSRNGRGTGSLQTSRKDFLWRIVGSASIAFTPFPSRAAGPITERETDSLAIMAKRALRPKPPKLLRRKLSQDFAVLLMRSSYNALDKLDCVAMVGEIVAFCQTSIGV